MASFVLKTCESTTLLMGRNKLFLMHAGSVTSEGKAAPFLGKSELSQIIFFLNADGTTKIKQRSDIPQEWKGHQERTKSFI